MLAWKGKKVQTKSQKEKDLDVGSCMNVSMTSNDKMTRCSRNSKGNHSRKGCHRGTTMAAADMTGTSTLLPLVFAPVDIVNVHMGGLSLWPGAWGCLPGRCT